MRERIARVPAGRLPTPGEGAADAGTGPVRLGGVGGVVDSGASPGPCSSWLIEDPGVHPPYCLRPD